ncbi:Uncharacterised protein [Citrobacter freundii]|nr:Uncharacterised protein [Citrobacter freundii]
MRLYKDTAGQVVEPTLAGGNPDFGRLVFDYDHSGLWAGKALLRGKRYWKKAACSFALWSLVRA